MAQEQPARDDQREQRLAQIVGGAQDEYERIGAWYDYLVQRLHFPFRARCIRKPAGSPLRLQEKVDVIDLTSVDDWEEEARVTLGAVRAGLDVPLFGLQPSASADEPTRQAVADWDYWVQRGYHFGSDDQE